MPFAGTPFAALDALRQHHARRRQSKAIRATLGRLNMSKPDSAPAAMRSLTVSVARELGAALVLSMPLQQRLDDAGRLALFTRAGAAFAAAVTCTTRSGFYRDGYAVLDGGAASAELALFLQQEFIPASRGGAPFVALSGNSRSQSAFGSVAALGGFSSAVLMPALRALAGPSVGGRPRDHFRANEARFFVAPAGTEDQDDHADRQHAASLHFALTGSQLEQGTRLWPGSHLTGTRGSESVSVALKAGQMLVAISALLHSGRAIDGSRGVARVFAYADAITEGGRFWEASTVRCTEHSFGAERAVLDVPIGGGGRRTRSRGGKAQCSCCED